MADEGWLGEELTLCAIDEASSRRGLLEEWEFYCDLFDMASRASTLHRLICVFGTVVQTLELHLAGVVGDGAGDSPRSPQQRSRSPSGRGPFAELPTGTARSNSLADVNGALRPYRRMDGSSESISASCDDRSPSAIGPVGVDGEKRGGDIDEEGIPFDAIGERFCALVPTIQSILIKMQVDRDAQLQYAATLEKDMLELRESGNQALYETDEVVAGLREKIDSLALEADMAREDMRYWQEEAAAGQRSSALRMRIALSALAGSISANGTLSDDPPYDGIAADAESVGAMSPMIIACAATSLWEVANRSSIAMASYRELVDLIGMWNTFLVRLCASTQREELRIHEALEQVMQQAAEGRQQLDVAHEELLIWQRRVEVVKLDAAESQRLLRPLLLHQPADGSIASRDDDEEEDAGFLPLLALNVTEQCARREVDLQRLEGISEMSKSLEKSIVTSLQAVVADRQMDLEDLIDQLEAEHLERTALDNKVRRHQSLLEEKQTDIANLVGVARAEIDKKDSQLHHLKERSLMERSLLEKDIAVLIEELDEKERLVHELAAAVKPKSICCESAVQTEGDHWATTPPRSTSRGSMGQRQFFVPLPSLNWPDFLVCCFDASRAVLPHPASQMTLADSTETPKRRGSVAISPSSPPGTLTNRSFLGSGDDSGSLLFTSSMLVVDAFSRSLIEVVTTVVSGSVGDVFRRRIYSLNNLLSVDRSFRDRCVLRFRFKSSSVDFRFVNEVQRERCYEAVSLAHPSLKCFSSSLRCSTTTCGDELVASSPFGDADVSEGVDDQNDFETIIDARGPDYMYMKASDIFFGQEGSCDLVKSCLKRGHVAIGSSPRSPLISGGSPGGALATTMTDDVAYDSCCRLNVAVSHEQCVKVRVLWNMQGRIDNENDDDDDDDDEAIELGLARACHIVLFAVPAHQTGSLKELLHEAGFAILCSEVEEPSRTFLGLASLPSVIPSMRDVNLIFRKGCGMVSFLLCETSVALFVASEAAASQAERTSSVRRDRWSAFCESATPTCCDLSPSGADIMASFHHAAFITSTPLQLPLPLQAEAIEVSCVPLPETSGEWDNALPIGSVQISDEVFSQRGGEKTADDTCAVREVVGFRTVDRRCWRLAERRAGHCATFDLTATRPHSSLVDTIPNVPSRGLRTLSLRILRIKLSSFVDCGGVSEQDRALPSIEFISHLLAKSDPIELSRSTSALGSFSGPKRLVALQSVTYCRSCLAGVLIHVVISCERRGICGSASLALGAQDLLCRITCTRAGGAPVGSLEFEWAVV